MLLVLALAPKRTVSVKRVFEHPKTYFRLLVKKIITMLGSREGGMGSGTPLENHKNIVFASNTGADTLKNPKTTAKQHSMFGHHRHASKTPFKWRFACGLIMTRL